MNNNLWYKDAVFYQLAVRAFKDSNGDGQGDLRGLTEKLDYLQTLGVDCVWLMPIYPSPLRDDGYDIADYCSVAESFGTLDDLKALIEAAHARNIRIVMDLVLNHTSDQHPWFQAARSDPNSPYREYYVWSETDQRYRGARIIFLDTEQSNWTWDECAGKYFWHRFYSSQPDLNYDNPHVQEEMLQIAAFWLEIGIDGFRADAVPYLFEREGTSCENLPETHAYLKKLREFIDQRYPGRILLCEANQWPEDVRPYFGEGDEFHMGFHFPIMPRIFMALKKGRYDDLAEIEQRTPPIPDTCQWCIFLRNHDELTLEMVTDDEREWMWRHYSPNPRMRLNLGIRRRLAPLLDFDRSKIEVANSLLLTLRGSPIIYYGDEIGMGDNLNLPDRNGVRTPMQWDSSPQAGLSVVQPFAPLAEGQGGPAHTNVRSQMADSGSLFHAMRHMLAVRRAEKAFGRGDLAWIDAGNPAIAAYRRTYDGRTLLILNNLSDASCEASLAPDLRATYTDLLTEQEYSAAGSLTLNPYQYLWLRKDG